MILTFAVLCTLLMFTFRWSAMAWYNSLHRQGFNLQRSIIVGTGQSAAIVQYELHKHREIGFDIVGFVRDPAESVTHEKSQVFPILGDIENLLDILKAQNIHELIIATPSDSREMIARCKREGVNVRLVTDLQSLSMQEMEFEELAGIPIVYFQANPLLGLNLFLKRTMDILLSSLGLLLLSPVFAAIAVLIKWESRGPVIFKQERIGKHGQPFTCYKFRSMCDQAEYMKEGLQAVNEATGPLFKIRDDPRITRVGKFLRRYSLDEWPQLVNVFTGDMSLVGPRPAVPREVEQYSAWAAKRLDIRPGITGLWQVSGRSDLPFDEMLKLDIYYIWNWSLSNDFKILLRTIPVVLSGKGAY
jgi:exopolysaccharide biosynthesis polyprenyl glycosylphosphotransferase